MLSDRFCCVGSFGLVKILEIWLEERHIQFLTDFLGLVVLRIDCL